MRRSLCTLLAASIALASCKDSTAPGGSLPGLYSLVSDNGQKPPIVITNGTDFKSETLDDRYALRADGSYTQTVIQRFTTPASTSTSTDSVVGKYIVNGSTITFTIGSTTYDMAVGKSTLTRSSGNRTRVYQK
jgi:hypothetical protein